MTTRLEIGRGLIVVRARIWGPLGASTIPMALDTGASVSMINVARLLAIGYARAAAVGRASVTTASGSENAMLFDISSIEVLVRDEIVFASFRTAYPRRRAWTDSSASIFSVIGGS